MNHHSNAETVVIGGGAVGTAVACFLARAGMDVALVERGEFAWGTSRRCEGNIAAYDSPPGYFSRLCKLGIDLFDVIVPELDYDVHFERTGCGLLVDDENALETARVNYEGKKAEGIPVSFLDRAEVRHRFPFISDSVLACIDFESDRNLSPMRLAFGLADLAKRRGAAIHTRTNVSGLKVANGAIAGVETGNGFIAAKNVVLAAGVWTPMIGYMAGINVPVRPRQGQILVTERQQGYPHKSFSEFGYIAAKGGEKRNGLTPEMERYGVAMVFEPTEGATCLIGSSRQFVGMNTEPHPAVLKAMAQRAIQFFPALALASFIRAFAGVRPSTPDGKPIISDTDVRGLYLATGHEGNGIGLSLVTGLLISQMLAGGEPAIDLAPLDLRRFSSEHHAPGARGKKE